MRKNLGRMVVAVVLVGSVTFGGSNTAASADQGGGTGAASTACHTTLNSGAGVTFMGVCFSNHGNVIRFESPAGAEHLSVGYFAEGYAVCSTGAVHGWDTGQDEAGWGAPTISQPNGANTLPLTITRTSLDGKIRLTQSFGRSPATKLVKVNMRVLNLSTATLTDVKLVRYYDGDIDNSPGDDVYMTSADSVLAVQSGGSGSALTQTAATLPLPHQTSIETFSDWDPNSGGQATTCIPVTTQAGPTAAGDYVGRLVYTLGNLKAGQSKQGNINYRRI